MISLESNVVNMHTHTHILLLSIAVTGAEYESAVARIVDMGFDRSEVEAALSKSFNNPDRAVEYLFSVRKLLVRWSEI